MSRVRTFFRRNYTTLMLAVIVASIGGSLILLANVYSKQSEQITTIQYLAEQIAKDSQEQHDKQDVRQECFFDLFVSYVNSKQPIAQADVDKCRVVAMNEQAPIVIIEPAPTAPEPETKPGMDSEKPAEEDKEEPNADDRATGLIENVTQGLSNLIWGLTHIGE